MRIRSEEFLKIRRELKSIKDVNKLSLPRGTLHSILQQKKVENVKRKYHTFVGRMEEIAEHWKNEKALPKWLTLPPVMKVRLLMKGMGFSAKEINKALSNPSVVDDDKLVEEIKRAVTRDFVYSPIAAKIQRARGKLGERALAHELKTFGFDFKVEKELMGKFGKTPDFYFEEPVKLYGRELRWIESKALFGDSKNHDLFWRKQYSKYKEMFGDGMVVYWLGCVEGVDASDGSEFRNSYKNSLLDMLIYITDSRDESYAEKLSAVFLEVGEDDEIKAAEKIADAYANGRVLAFTENKEEVAKILRNMGFDVVLI